MVVSYHVGAVNQTRVLRRAASALNSYLSRLSPYPPAFSCDLKSKMIQGNNLWPHSGIFRLLVQGLQSCSSGSQMLGMSPASEVPEFPGLHHW